MERLKVSVIVPVYNVEKYIAECITSILEQTYEQLELILVDDCSADNSFSICQSYAEKDARIVLLRNAVNSGVSFSRNHALEHATGEYILMVDSDDWIEKNCIELMVNAIEHTNADACACGHIKEYENSHEADHIRIIDKEQVLSNTQILNCAMRKKAPFVGYIWSKLYRKRMIDINNLRFDTDISLCEDSLFNYSYFDTTKDCVLIAECLYHYRIRSQSASAAKTATTEKIKTKLYAYQSALHIAQKHPNTVFYYKVHATLFSTAIQYIVLSYSKGTKISDDACKQMMGIAKTARHETKIQYTGMKELIYYYLLVISPKIVEMIWRIKNGRQIQS